MTAEIADFGDNPGNLRLFVHMPDPVQAPAPLVVLLHGCYQDGAEYAASAGWLHLADRWGFIVAMAEQKRENNINRCFRWYDPGHTRRDQGEVASVRQMVAHLHATLPVDPARVFVTGLSSGGMLTGALLACYPQVFAGGAILAGMPYGCADGMIDGVRCMIEGKVRPPQEWGDRVRAASSHQGPWPRVSIWHGTRDATVRPLNATELMKQWTDVHGVGQTPQVEETVDGYPRRAYCDGRGREVVETWEITGMAHGVPVAGTPNGFYSLSVNIASSYHIGRFWGLEPFARTQAPSLVSDLAFGWLRLLPFQGWAGSGRADP